MRIVLATWGSLGDLHPFLAVGLGLKRRGHSVTLATCSVYRDKVEGEGLGFFPLRPELSETPELVARLMDQKQGSVVVLRELIAPAVRETYEDLLYACEGADLLLSHSLIFGAPLLSERMGLPFVSVVLQPTVFCSAYDPCVVPSAPQLAWLRHLGPGVNRAFFALGKKATRHWFAPVDALRHDLELPPTPLSPIFDGQFSSLGTLALFSPVLAAPQPDWPAKTLATGFPFYDTLTGGEAPKLSPELEAFLTGGEPPLVFTLGSSAVKTAGEFFPVSVAAAQALGRRAVLLTGRDQAVPTNLPSSVLAVPYAPHSLLMPRGCVTVHQGGVGTTGQALRAGVPQVIVPFAHDQPDHAARIVRLGVGKAIARNRYTPAHVTRILAAVLGDKAIVRRAATVGEQVRAENGVDVACDFIEKVIQTLPQ